MSITTRGWGDYPITTFGWGGREVQDRAIVIETDFRITTVLDLNFETGITLDHQFNLSTEMVFLLAAAISLDGNFDVATELDTEMED